MEELGGLGGLSAAGIFILIILREVFSFLKDKEDDRPSAPDPDPDCVKEIDEQLKLIREAQVRTAANCDKLAEVMSAKDVDGLPLVYTPRSLGKSIEALSTSINKLADDVRGS